MARTRQAAVPWLDDGCEGLVFLEELVVRIQEFCLIKRQGGIKSGGGGKTSPWESWMENARLINLVVGRITCKDVSGSPSSAMSQA